MFVNKFENNLDATKEIVAAGYDKKMKFKPMLLWAIAILYLIGGYISDNYFFLLVSALAVFAVFVNFLKRRAFIRQELARVKVLYKKKTPIVTVKIADNISTFSDKVERCIEYCDIMKVFKSKNFIILLIKGNMLIAIKKDGFETGNANECMEFIKNKIKNK